MPEGTKEIVAVLVTMFSIWMSTKGQVVDQAGLTSAVCSVVLGLGYVVSRVWLKAKRV